MVEPGFEYRQLGSISLFLGGDKRLGTYHHIVAADVLNVDKITQAKCSERYVRQNIKQ